MRRTSIAASVARRRRAGREGAQSKMTGRLLVSRKLGGAATFCLLGAALITSCGGGEGEPLGGTGTDEARLNPTGSESATLSTPVPTRPALEMVSELAAHNPTLLERFLPEPEVQLRKHGDKVLPKLKEGSPSLAIGLELGASARSRARLYPIENPEQALALTPLRARDVEGQVQQDGRIVYPQAFTGTDLILTPNHDRLLTTLLLQSDRSPADFRWKLEIAEGLRQVESSRNETALVDSDGHLRLTIREASIIGADGVVEHAPVTLGSDGLASLLIEHQTVVFPAVVQFEVEAPPIALAVLPPEIIKARMMVLVDTSGSMIRSFNDESSQSGDSDGTAVFCDNGIGTGFSCSANVACTLGGSTPGLNLFPASNPDTNPSRMLGAKRALWNVFNANSGLIDFGLMRYREHDTWCTGNAAYCCPTATGSSVGGRCVEGQNAYNGPTIVRPDGCVIDPGGCDSGTCSSNVDGNGNAACTCNGNNQCDGLGGFFPSIDDNDNDCVGNVCMVTMNNAITYAGQSPTQCAASVGAGGRVLVEPGPGSAPLVRNWVDFVEDFCSSTGTPNGPPRNPELRADGYTPLAYSIDTARTDWYQPAYDAWDTNNTGHQLYDAKFDCRPYVLVAMTDGTDTCAADRNR